MAAGMKSFSKTFVWILMGMLIVGLAGFGALNLTGTVRTVATVGSQTVTVDDFARELQREMRAIEAQTGQQMQMAQVRQFGLDQRALSQLVALASLDNEVDALGLSVGDENLQKEIVSIPAFQGIDGTFDRESYRFQLQQAGIDEVAFEQDLRTEAARTLVQGAIIAGVKMPAVMTDTLADYVGARRSFTLAQVDLQSLAAPLQDPTEDQLRSFYDAHTDTFVLPETKRLSYVLLAPEMLLNDVELDETAVRDLYDSRASDYNIPERRLVERLVFADQAAASDAKAQLEVGGTTFESLVTSRELTLADIDMGDVTLDDLGDAGNAVFGAEIGAVVGPVETPLGPALFRVNGTLAEQITSFNDVRPQLRDELGRERARRLIEAQAENINDLLAGGATLEELADETDMDLGTIDWSSLSYDGIAAYDAFREVAEQVSDKDFPEISFLEDGGMFALRLDDTLPERPEPFADARNRVIAGWRLDQTNSALTARAQEVVTQLAVDGDFTATGLPHRVENGLTRTAYLDGTPADFMTQVFAMEPDEMRVIAGEGSVWIVRLDGELPPDDNEEMQSLRTAMGQELDQVLSQALFETFARDTQLRGQPQIDQQALNAVLTSFQ